MATYKEIVGQKITKVTSDPSEPKTGQMWYNSTTGTLRGLGVISAWASGGPVITARQTGGAAGQGPQTASLIFGGFTPPPFSSLTEEYNGSGFSTGGALPAAVAENRGAGTQTAALSFMGLSNPSTHINASFEYDGSSWGSPTSMNTSRYSGGGAGIQTAGLGFGGYTTTSVANTEEYNGSSWTNVNSMSTARYSFGSAGIQTSAVAVSGVTPPGRVNSVEEYDGTNWTAGTNYPVTVGGLNGFGATNTAAIFAGGATSPPTIITTCNSYDGTSFASVPSLSNSASGGYTGGSNTAGLYMSGIRTAPGTSATDTEEFTTSTNTITAAAFSSGGAANFARRQLGYTGAGTQNAFMVYGGFSPSGMVNNSEEYGGATWTATPTLNTARGQNAGFGITTAAVACGGAAPTIGGYTEEYNGSSWTTGNSMSTSRYEFGATGILTAGLALQGDQGPSTPFGVTCEEYDGTNWSSGGSANTARRTNSGVGTQTATITAGGQTSPGTTANVESYDGTSWSEVNNLNVSRGGNAIMGGPAGATTSVVTGGSPGPVAITEQWNGTNMVTGVNMANDRSVHGAGGTSASGIVGLGQTGPSPPYGDVFTEEYNGETTVANVKNFSTS
jgi:hypothetical protein